MTTAHLGRTKHNFEELPVAARCQHQLRRFGVLHVSWIAIGSNETSQATISFKQWFEGPLLSPRWSRQTIRVILETIGMDLSGFECPLYYSFVRGVIRSVDTALLPLATVPALPRNEHSPWHVITFFSSCQGTSGCPCGESDGHSKGCVSISSLTAAFDIL